MKRRRTRMRIYRMKRMTIKMKFGRMIIREIKRIKKRIGMRMKRMTRRTGCCALSISQQEKENEEEENKDEDGGDQNKEEDKEENRH